MPRQRRRASRQNGRAIGPVRGPPIFSHEFIINNHADIASMTILFFVTLLLDDVTEDFASMFVYMQHNVTGEVRSEKFPKGKPFTYVAGVKDTFITFYYSLAFISVNALIREFILDRISRSVQLCRVKQPIFYESSLCLVFSVISFLIGADVILKENYYSNIKLLWEGYPNHIMSSWHKYFFILQMAYYFHLLPEIYLQKVEQEKQLEMFLRGSIGLFFTSFTYGHGYHRLILIIFTLHYLSEIVNHLFQLIKIFVVFRNYEKYKILRDVNAVLFGVVRFVTLSLTIVCLMFIVGERELISAYVTLFSIVIIYAYLIYDFILKRMQSRDEDELRFRPQSQASRIRTMQQRIQRDRERRVAEQNRTTVRRNRGTLRVRERR